MLPTDALSTILIILAAMVVMVSLFQRAGLGAILGYLTAGILIGPSALGLVTETELIAALGEFGVVFLMFVIGLELPLERIQVMRTTIFGLGMAQLIVTTAAGALAATLLGFDLYVALVIGAALSLSSTAVVITLLADRKLLTSRFGRTAFAVLLMQDLAVGPLLAMFSALGSDQSAMLTVFGTTLAKAVVAVLVIFALGRTVLRWTYGLIGSRYTAEVFAALTLFTVLGASMLTHELGLSLGFGAFLAGMLLAETHYRHQVAAEIQPFRGLLLGLFFISVGMGVDLRLIAEHAAVVGLLVVGLLTGKAFILAGLTRLSGLSWSESIRVSILMSQGGEFSLVILTAGLAAISGLQDTLQILIAVVGISMLLTPFLSRLGDRAAAAIERRSAVQIDDDTTTFDGLTDHVVIAGIGRTGRAVTRHVVSSGLPFIAVDTDPHRISQAQEDGLNVYFGDASRPDVLAAMNLGNARALIVTIDDPDQAVQIVTLAHYIFPELKIYARAVDEDHSEELERAGADVTVSDFAPLSVRMADTVLQS